MLLLSAALAFALAAGLAATGLPPWLAAPFAVAGGWLLPGRGRQRPLRIAAALITVAFACWYVPGRLAAPPAGDVAALAGQQARLLVRADENGDPHPTYTALAVSVLAHLDGEIRQPLGGRLRLLLPPGTEIRDGDRWLVVGRVDAAPAGSYGDWLRQNGLDGSLFPRLAQLQQRSSAPPWTRAWGWLQARVARGLSGALPPREAAFAQTLVFGGRHALPAELQADLTATGTSHLATVTAFNLLLLYGLIVAASAPLVGRRWAILLGLAFAAGYAAAVGLHPPVLRGLVITAWLALAALSGRPWSRGVALVDALAILLLPQPALLRDAAFQLTFAAAFGIAVIAPFLAQRLGRLAGETDPVGVAGSLSAAALTSIAASLASLPFIAARFGTPLPLAMPANAMITPLVPAMAVLAFVSGLATAAAAWLAPVAAPLWLLLLFSEHLVRALASLPLASPTSAVAGVAGTAAAAAATLVWAGWLRRSRRAGATSDRRWSGSRLPRPLLVPLYGLAGAVIVAGLAMPMRGSASAAPPTITLLPVKGATALLLTATNGNRLLLSDSDAPAALAFALEATLPPGAALSAAIPLDARAGTLAALRAVAGDALLCPGAASDGRCSPPAEATGTAGELELALGGADRLRLSGDGVHPLAAILYSRGRTTVLAGQPAADSVPTGVDLVLLPAWSRSTSHLWLQRLAPRAVLLLGEWPPEARRTIAALLPAASVSTTTPGELLRFAGDTDQHDAVKSR